MKDSLLLKDLKKMWKKNVYKEICTNLLSTDLVFILFTFTCNCETLFSMYVIRVSLALDNFCVGCRSTL